MKFALLLLLGLAFATAACGSPLTEEAAKRQGWENFQTAVASDRNYDIYWMGREFTAGGFVFKGPDANLEPGIGDVKGGGLEMYYTPSQDCGCPSLTLTLYSRPAWDRFPPKTELPGRRKTAVQVNGQPAELWTRFDSRGKIVVQTLVIDYGRTVVEALAATGLPTIPRTPGPDPNPLMDEATFLAAMQNLRPYPE